MIIADTSIWIEFLRGNEDISSLFVPYLRKRHIYANSVVFGELIQGSKNRRERNILKDFWENLPRVDERNCFIDAGKISNEFKLYSLGVGLIDCYILACAVRNSLAIWTLDKKFLKAIEMVAQ